MSAQEGNGPSPNPFRALRSRLGPLPPGPPAPAAPAPAEARSGARELPVHLRLERKGHGGKIVTWVEGPGLAGSDLPNLAREAARGLGVGARVEGSAIVVQGSQQERLEAWLGARGYGAVRRAN